MEHTALQEMFWHRRWSSSRPPLRDWKRSSSLCPGCSTTKACSGAGSETSAQGFSWSLHTALLLEALELLLELELLELELLLLLLLLLLPPLLCAPPLRYMWAGPACKEAGPAACTSAEMYMLSRVASRAAASAACTLSLYTKPAAASASAALWKSSSSCRRLHSLWYMMWSSRDTWPGEVSKGSRPMTIWEEEWHRQSERERGERERGK
jgi:hypothetical protein